MEEIKERFEKYALSASHVLGDKLSGIQIYNHEESKAIMLQDFIQSEIDLAVSKERENIKNMLWQVREDWRNDGQIQVLDTADYLINLINTK